MGVMLTGCAGNYTMRYGPPPPPRIGVMGVAPGVGFVWTDGYWDQRGGRWVWTNGRWQRPPHRRAVWVSGAWFQEGRNWRFRRGYWR
jgi:hypothetical protein